MKIETRNDMDLLVDLSDQPEEVTNYLFDQLEDRINDLDITELIAETEIDTDYENQKLEITSPLLNLIHKIIEEKQHDIDWERRHGERE